MLVVGRQVGLGHQFGEELNRVEVHQLRFGFRLLVAASASWEQGFFVLTEGVLELLNHARSPSVHGLCA